jgi:phage terminase large subunit GpA-like protein
MMNSREFAKYLAIQPYCPHCGDTETLVPNHRASRGIGSPKSLNRPSNIVVLCSLMNGLIESDAKAAQTARRYGWKLSKYQNPTEQPYFDLVAGKWFLLSDDFTKGVMLE